MIRSLQTRITMDAKVLAVIAAVAIIAVGGGIAIYATQNNDSPGDGDNPTDADMIASAFTKNYSGFFGKDFYLKDGATSAEAKAYYPNGNTSSYGSNENYIRFVILKDESSAKDEFDTNKTDYTGQIGRVVMGGTIMGTYAKGGLDDSIGYYNNYNMGTPSTYLYLTGYYNTMFFESYISLKNTSITGDTEISLLVDAIMKSVNKPLSTDDAKKYVEPTDPSGPSDVTYSGAALKCYNFLDKAKTIGTYVSEYTMTKDSTAMSGKLQSGDEKYFVEIKILPGTAQSTYEADETTYNSKIGTAISDDTYHGISECTGATDGCGVYYSSTMGANKVNVIEYSCYNGNYYAHMKLRATEPFTDTTASDAVKELIAAMTASS